MKCAITFQSFLKKPSGLLQKGQLSSGHLLIITAQAHTESTAEESNETSPASFADTEPEKPLEKLNISRLRTQHRNMLYNRLPYDEPQSWIHKTEKYNRMMLGRYGLASGVDPRICFPTKKDLELRAEYESVAFPHTIPEMIEMNRKAKEEKLAQIRKREEDIEKKLSKLDNWKRELNAKIAKKEADARAAKERKERLIEEVRRHFGFKVDPRDDRFKEMLEQKEREDRKKTKEAKRQVKETKMVAKLKEKAKTLNAASDEAVEKPADVKKKGKADETE